MSGSERASAYKPVLLIYTMSPSPNPHQYLKIGGFVYKICFIFLLTHWGTENLSQRLHMTMASQNGISASPLRQGVRSLVDYGFRSSLSSATWTQSVCSRLSLPCSLVLLPYRNISLFQYLHKVRRSRGLCDLRIPSLFPFLYFSCPAPWASGFATARLNYIL